MSHVCPICLDDFLLVVAPIQCDAPVTHGRWQFEAGEWFSIPTAASSVGIDNHLDQTVEWLCCRWGCGQPVHKECMREWTSNHRNECVILSAVVGLNSSSQTIIAHIPPLLFTSRIVGGCEPQPVTRLAGTRRLPSQLTCGVCQGAVLEHPSRVGRAEQWNRVCEK